MGSLLGISNLAIAGSTATLRLSLCARERETWHRAGIYLLTVHLLKSCWGCGSEILGRPHGRTAAPSFGRTFSGWGYRPSHDSWLMERSASCRLARLTPASTARRRDFSKS